MKILLLKTWLTNIGNGFIDKGARAAIEQAAPNAEIVEASGYPNYFTDQKMGGITRGADTFLGSFGSKLEHVNRWLNQRRSNRLINIGELVDADLAVFPGCVLYEFALRKYQPTLEVLAKRGTPMIFLGAGGVDYLPETVDHVSGVLGRLNTVGFISRDDDAYESYADQFDISYSGIDCGFFINDWFTPPTADERFITATFDKVEEPEFRTSHRIIRPTHTPFSDLSATVAMAKEFVPGLDHRGPQDLFQVKDSFLSDSLEDYLFLYANAVQTHSDRIHACVPALTYGNEARFYYSTPRAGLFDTMLESDITEETVSVDEEKLKRQKNEQVDQLEMMIAEV